MAQSHGVMWGRETRSKFLEVGVGRHFYGPGYEMLR